MKQLTIAAKVTLNVLHHPVYQALTLQILGRWRR